MAPLRPLRGRGALFSGQTWVVSVNVQQQINVCFGNFCLPAVTGKVNSTEVLCLQYELVGHISHGAFCRESRFEVRLRSPTQVAKATAAQSEKKGHRCKKAQFPRKERRRFNFASGS